MQTVLMKGFTIKSFLIIYFSFCGIFWNFKKCCQEQMLLAAKSYFISFLLELGAVLWFTSLRAQRRRSYRVCRMRCSLPAYRSKGLPQCRRTWPLRRCPWRSSSHMSTSRPLRWNTAANRTGSRMGLRRHHRPAV